MEEALEALERERLETEQSLREALARRSLATRGGSRGPSRRGPTPSRQRGGSRLDEGADKDGYPAEGDGLEPATNGQPAHGRDDEARAVDALDWQSGQEGSSNGAAPELGQGVGGLTAAPQPETGGEGVDLSMPDSLAAVFAAQRPSSEYRRNDKYGSFADLVLMRGASPDGTGRRGGSPSPPASPSGRRRGNLLDWLAVDAAEGETEVAASSAGGGPRSPSPSQRVRAGSEFEPRDPDEPVAPVPLRLGPVIGVAIASPHSPVAKRAPRGGTAAGGAAFGSARTPSVADDGTVGFVSGSLSGREGLLTGIAALERLEARIVGMEENFASRREAAANAASSRSGGGGGSPEAASGRVSAGGSPGPSATAPAGSNTSSPLGGKGGKDSSPETKVAAVNNRSASPVAPSTTVVAAVAVPASTVTTSTPARSSGDATFITLPPELSMSSLSDGGGSDAEGASERAGTVEETSTEAAAGTARMAAPPPEALASPLPPLVGSPLLPPPQQPAATGGTRGATGAAKSEALRQRLNAQQRQQQQQQPSPLWARLQRSPLAAGQARPGARARPLASGLARPAIAGGAGQPRGRQLTKGSNPAGAGERMSLAARSYSCPPPAALWRQGEGSGAGKGTGPASAVLMTGQKAAGTASGQPFATMLQQRRLRAGGATSVPPKPGVPAPPGARGTAPKGAHGGEAPGTPAAVLPLRHTASRSSRPVGSRPAATNLKAGQARDTGTRINVSKTVLNEFTDLLASFKTQKSVVRGLLHSPPGPPGPARRIGPSAEAVAAAMRGERGAAAAEAAAQVPLARKAWGSSVSPVRSPSTNAAELRRRQAAAGAGPSSSPWQGRPTPLRGGGALSRNNEASPPQPASVPGTAPAIPEAPLYPPQRASPAPSRPGTRMSGGAGAAGMGSRLPTRNGTAAGHQHPPFSQGGGPRAASNGGGVASPAPSKRQSRLAASGQPKGARGHHDPDYASELLLGRATTPGPLAGWGGNAGGGGIPASGVETTAAPVLTGAAGSLMTAFDISPPATPPYGGRDGGSGDAGVDVLVSLLASPILLPPTQASSAGAGGARSKATPSQTPRGGSSIPASPLAAAGARSISSVPTPSRGGFQPTGSRGSGAGYAPPPPSVPPLALR